MAKKKKVKKESAPVFDKKLTRNEFMTLIRTPVYDLGPEDLQLLCQIVSITILHWEKNGRYARFRLTNEFFDSEDANGNSMELSQWWDVMSDSSANIHRVLSGYFNYIDFNNTLGRFNGDLLEVYSQEDLVAMHQFFFEGFAYYMEKEEGL